MKRAHGGMTNGGVLDFSASINPLGFPPSVRRVLDRTAELVVRYPHPDARPLREALARRHQISPACILVGNGSAELIYLLVRDLRIAVFVPAFTEYEDAAASAMPVPWSQFPRAPNADAIVVGNPNNPTGHLTRPEQILRLPGLVIVDEAFMDFVGDEASLVRYAAETKRVIVVRSLTKFYALPGLRLGYIVAHPKVIARLRERQPPWSVNGIAQAAGIAALEDAGFAERTRIFIRETRDDLRHKIPLESLPSEANFLLCRTPKDLVEPLAERGIAVRDCSSFTGLDRNHLRVAVRLPEENARLVSAMKEVLA